MSKAYVDETSLGKKKNLFIYLRERTGEHELGGGAEEKNLK